LRDSRRMKTSLETLPLTLKMNDWFSFPRVAAVLALGLLLTVSMGCASSPARDSEDGDQLASSDDQYFKELGELLKLVDDFNALLSPPSCQSMF
jgi:hypothetical protein